MNHKSRRCIKNIKMLCNAREKVTNLFNDYFTIVPDSEHASVHEEELKILSPKQMIQRLPMVLAQVKAGNLS